MRILVYGLSSDKLGGIETFLLNMNKFMSDDMIFDYIVEGDNTIHQSEIKNKGGNVYFIPQKRDMFHNILQWDKLLKSMKNNNEVAKVLYFNMYSLAWSLPMIVGMVNGYKVVLHAHNNKLHNCSSVLKAMHAFSRCFLGMMNIHRVTNSQLSSEFFFGNKPSKMIHNAIDVERFKYDEIERQLIRKELGILDKHVYGFSGRLAYQKNPVFLIEIFAEIKTLDEDAAFLICGDGDLADAVKQKAKEYDVDVLFLGNVLNIEAYYQAMDVFILPSRFEGLGIVLIEAQTAGLPCITSEKVVPLDAKVTDLLSYLPLEAGPKKWAENAVCMCRNREKNRIIYGEQIKVSNYNIVNEANNLETYLKECIE